VRRMPLWQWAIVIAVLWFGVALLTALLVIELFKRQKVDAAEAEAYLEGYRDGRDIEREHPASLPGEARHGSAGH
jgi:hypothetical protein